MVLTFADILMYMISALAVSYMSILIMERLETPSNLTVTSSVSHHKMDVLR